MARWSLDKAGHVAADKLLGAEAWRKCRSDSARFPFHSIRFSTLPLPYLPFIGMVASAIRLLDGLVWQQAKYEMAAPFRGKREALQSRDTDIVYHTKLSHS